MTFIITSSEPTERSETLPAATGPVGGVPVGCPQLESEATTSSPVEALAMDNKLRRVSGRWSSQTSRSKQNPRRALS